MKSKKEKTKEESPTFRFSLFFFFLLQSFESRKIPRKTEARNVIKRKVFETENCLFFDLFTAHSNIIYRMTTRKPV